MIFTVDAIKNTQAFQTLFASDTNSAPARVTALLATLLLEYCRGNIKTARILANVQLSILGELETVRSDTT